jgi:hypothetical protein
VKALPHESAPRRGVQVRKGELHVREGLAALPSCSGMCERPERPSESHKQPQRHKARYREGRAHEGPYRVVFHPLAWRPHPAISKVRSGGEASHGVETRSRPRRPPGKNSRWQVVPVLHA